MIERRHGFEIGSTVVIAALLAVFLTPVGNAEGQTEREAGRGIEQAAADTLRLSAATPLEVRVFNLPYRAGLLAGMRLDRMHFQARDRPAAAAHPIGRTGRPLRVPRRSTGRSGVAPGRIEGTLTSHLPAGHVIDFSGRLVSRLPVDDANAGHAPAWGTLDLRATARPLCHLGFGQRLRRPLLRARPGAYLVGGHRNRTVIVPGVIRRESIPRPPFSERKPTMSADHPLRQIITDGMPSQLPDIAPEETQDWLDSLDAVVERHGRERARFLMLKVLERARADHLGIPALRSTDYINTIPPEREPEFPGDEALEHRIKSIIRWNAAVMVTRANRPEFGVGGHIATYASAADLYEVGFNHFFRGKWDPDGPRPGDQLFLQGHSSPGIYARAFLEGRLTEDQLDLFRQETRVTADGRPGLSSYPHPRLMPDFWEFPTVSMGLGAITSIYQARFNRYLHHRGLRDTRDSRVWAFLGDGEMDEPEALGALTVPAREGLDNLTWVINCNLQRLDGPVRGNGKIIQELESVFRGAGWNVIKVLWGHRWDELLALDVNGELVRKMNETPDGQFQTYTVSDGAYIRKHFFDTPELQRILAASSLGVDDLPVLDRGGHDYRKVYAAYQAATETVGQPTVILAQTIKGWTLGPDFESRNATHQMKKLSIHALQKFRDRLELDISDRALKSDLPPYYHPGEKSEEVAYLLERRCELGGYLPEREIWAQPVKLPDPGAYKEFRQGSGSREVATTMALVRLFRELAKQPDLGPRIVPIIPDEARTFGMDSWFREFKIYSPMGQQYEPVDRDMLIAYVEAQDGQIIHEGITEAGGMGTFHAAGSSYATMGHHMVPFYIFYSMFGFQRIADLIWSAADQRVRGFLIGATAGRTTLNGEGLQHEDGHSLLLAATNPAVIPFDASFAFELACVVRDGLERMLREPGEDIMYYLTVYNEPVNQPAMPTHVSEQDVVRGIYRYATFEDARAHRAQLLASGSAMSLALEAQRLLGQEWDVAADVWSVPGWIGLHREALACSRYNLLNPEQESRVPLITRLLSEADGPFVAVTDYQQAVPGLIAPWVPGRYRTLGTDGFGRSDTRPALRDLFGIDARHIVVAVLLELAESGEIERGRVAEAIRRYEIDPGATVELP